MDAMADPTPSLPGAPVMSRRAFQTFVVLLVAAFALGAAAASGQVSAAATPSGRWDSALAAPHAVRQGAAAAPAPALPVALEPVARVQDPPRETIYVVDTSGSMAGEPLEIARAALLVALRRRAPNDRFNVVAGGPVPRSAFPHSVPADLESLEEAARFVERLAAGGGTELVPALSLALSDAPAGAAERQVVLFSDGSGADEPQGLDFVAAGIGRDRLSTVAVGGAAGAGFLRAAAELGHGSFTRLASPAEVPERMATLLREIETPAPRAERLAAAAGWPPRAEFPEDPGVTLAALPRTGTPAALLLVCGSVFAAAAWLVARVR
jgi:hypothetical protein